MSPKYRSEPTGDTHTQTWDVHTLDVWGHAPSECCRAYDCPCIHESSDPTDEDDVEHDDMECQCHYEVNAAYRAGCISVEAEGTRYNVGTEHEFVSYHATHETLVQALIDRGFLKAGVTLDKDVRVDDVSDGSFLTIEEEGTGMPLFNLELEEKER